MALTKMLREGRGSRGRERGMVFQRFQRQNGLGGLRSHGSRVCGVREHHLQQTCATREGGETSLDRLRKENEI